LINDSFLCKMYKNELIFFLTYGIFFNILTLAIVYYGDERSFISMRGRHLKKSDKRKKPLVLKIVGAFVLVLAVTVTSFITAFANTVSVDVIDGELLYSFKIDNADADKIIEKAIDLGMEPLGKLDTIEQLDDNTRLNIRRGAMMTVKEAEETNEFVVYEGDTIENALEQNNILIKEKDQVNPSEETVIEEDVSVEIFRFNSVQVLADDKTLTVEMLGGTVQDALNEAKVSLSEDDSVNYDLEEPLEDGMQIEVSRSMKIRITVDGESKIHKLSAGSVGEAIKKAGITLSEDDIVNHELTAKLVNKMKIVIQRVEIKEEKEVAEIPYDTIEESSDDLFEDEVELKTEGVCGEKEILFKVRYVDGTPDADSKEVISEETLKEKIDAVVIKGTKKRPAEKTPAPTEAPKPKPEPTKAPEKTAEPESNFVPEEPNEKPKAEEPAGNTFTDASGKVVSYSKYLTGQGTAYCLKGTTASGHTTGYDYVAVNPNLIPLGSRLYVRSKDGAYSRYCIASDTGGALNSGRVLVDLWFETQEQCFAFGRRSIEVYILG
jgi:Uncharacterized protein conserved in bacteria